MIIFLLPNLFTRESTGFIEGQLWLNGSGLGIFIFRIKNSSCSIIIIRILIRLYQIKTLSLYCPNEITVTDYIKVKTPVRGISTRRG